MNPRDAVLKVIKRRDVDIDDTLARVERSYLALKDKLAEYMQANRGAEALSVAAARKDMERILVDSGVYEAVGNDDTYKNYLQSAQEVYSKAYGKNFTYSKVSKKELLLLKDQQFMKFERLTSAGRDLLADTVFNMRLGSMSLAEMKAQLSAVVDSGLARYVNTWIDTARTSYSNMASTRLAADNGITRFQYVGPSDKITRDFCNVHMDEVKTLEEWDALDNDQINPVSIYRGGYNCRHILVGVPSDMESLPEGTDAPKEDTTGGDLPKNEVARIEKPKPDITESVIPPSEDLFRVPTSELNPFATVEDAKTLPDLERYLVVGRDTMADLKAVSPRIVKDFINESDRLDAKYITPKIEGYRTKRMDAAPAVATHRMIGGKITDPNIWISTKYAKNPESFARMVGENVTEGQFSKTDPINYKRRIMTHEKAHTILDPVNSHLYSGAESANSIAAASEVNDQYRIYHGLYKTAKNKAFVEYVEKIKKVNGTLPTGRALDQRLRDPIKKIMGKDFLAHYADTNASEFFAEAFTEYENNSGELSPFAKKVGEIVSKYLGKKR